MQHKTDCLVGKNLGNTVRHWSQWISHNTWSASWEPDPDRRELGVLNLTLHWHIFGVHIKPLDLGFRTIQVCTHALPQELTQNASAFTT